MNRVLSIAAGVACSLLVVTSVSAKTYLCMYKKHICSSISNCYQSRSGQEWSFLLQTSSTCNKKSGQSATERYQLIKDGNNANSYLENKTGYKYRFRFKGGTGSRLRGGSKKITYGAFYNYSSAKSCITSGSDRYKNVALKGTTKKKANYCMQLENKWLFLYR